VNTCANCRFWNAWAAQPGNNTQAPIGDCRRHAPVLVPIIVASGPITQHVTSAHLKTKWPSVPAVQYCGEHQPTQGQDQPA
jgi:hypothetical protein